MWTLDSSSIGPSSSLVTGSPGAQQLDLSLADINPWVARLLSQLHPEDVEAVLELIIIVSGDACSALLCVPFCI